MLNDLCEVQKIQKLLRSEPERAEIFGGGKTTVTCFLQLSTKIDFGALKFFLHYTQRTVV